jgi:isopentenyl-diphosphate delta-isomerase
MEEQVVLVDATDSFLGTMGKTAAHEQGVLHRAISIILTNSQGEMLIQQRAMTKYHWAGIWSNAVCSHPRLHESYREAAQRRLKEELGIDTALKEEFSFIYKALDAESGLTEHEYDTVFSGIYEGPIPFNPEEVAAVRWIAPAALEAEIEATPEKFSFWFKIILQELKKRAA